MYHVHAPTHDPSRTHTLTPLHTYTYTQAAILYTPLTLPPPLTPSYLYLHPQAAAGEQEQEEGDGDGSAPSPFTGALINNIPAERVPQTQGGDMYSLCVCIPVQYLQHIKQSTVVAD